MDFFDFFPFAFYYAKPPAKEYFPVGIEKRIILAIKIDGTKNLRTQVAKITSNYGPLAVVVALILAQSFGLVNLGC